MKITKIDVETYEWPLPTPLSNGKITHTKTGMNLVKIETDEGITGFGQGYTKPIIKSAIRQFAEMLIGEDPIDVERLYELMWNPKRVGRRGLTTQAISAIDIALWDVRGKAANLPVYKLLGGFRQTIPAYMAGGYYAEGKGLKDLQEEMTSYVEAGARAIKMKIGLLSHREDIERVRAVRKAVGDDVKLMLDANCAYRTYEAVQIAQRLEEFDIFWFEEPVAPDDYEGFRRLSEMTTIPLAAGENEYTRYGFRDLIATGGVPILNPDAKIMGGITEATKVMALAQAHDLAVAPHGAQEVHIHLATAYSNSIILEYYPKNFDPMAGLRFTDPLMLDSDGNVRVLDLPGLGMEPAYANIEKYRVA